MQNSLGPFSAETEICVNTLQNLFDDRVKSIQRQVELFFQELEQDEVYKAVKESKYCKEFSGQRASELFEVYMRSEQEATIGKLQKMLAEANGKLKKLNFELEDLRQNRTQGFEQEFMRTKELEGKMEISRRELENSKQARGEELLVGEIEFLKKELKIRENSHLGEMEEVKKFYEDRVHELEVSYEALKGQFSGFQRQSTDLATDQEQVIKKLLEKTKDMKQKILSQKGRIEEMMKGQQKTVADYEKNLEEAENRYQRLQQENNERECEVVSKHRAQMVQLQTHFQELLNRKLLEMQKEVDQQVYKSQEHEQHVKDLLEAKLKEIETNFVHKDIHHQTVSEKESEKQRIQENLKAQIEKLKGESQELQKKIEEVNRGLDEQMNKWQELESSKQELEETLQKTQDSLDALQKDYETEIKLRKNHEKEIKALGNQLEQAKIALNEALVEIEATKADFHLTLLQKVNKADYEKLQEKLYHLNKELENRSIYITRLENEINILNNTLAEHSSIRSIDCKQLEQEKSQHQETKTRLFDLQAYSQQLLNDLSYFEHDLESSQLTISSLESQIASLHSALSLSKQDLHTFQQHSLAKDAETRIKYRLKLDSLKKSCKSSIFHLKTLHYGLLQYLEKEVIAFKKSFSALAQDLSFKLLASLLTHKKSSEQDLERMKKVYVKKFAALEESIRKEELGWDDLETEGVRRAIRGLVEEKQMALIENRTLKESIGKMRRENGELYGETQNLRERFHLTMGGTSELAGSLRSPAGILRPRLGSSYRDVFHPYN